MTLARYIAIRFLSAFLRVIAILTVLMFVVEFVETRRSMADTTDSLGIVFHLTLLSLPELVDRVFPLIILLTSLTLFVGLARTSELVISRAAGVSALRLLTVPVLLALLIGAVFVSVFNPIVAATIRSHDQLRAEVRQESRSVLSVSRQGIWLRQVVAERQTVIFARRASEDGSLLVEAEFHVFDEDGALQERLLADRAQIQGEVWRLSNLRRWNVQTEADGRPTAIQTEATAELPTNLSSDQILDSFAPPKTISVWQLPGIIDQLEQSGFTAQRHKLFLQSAMAMPLMLAAMVLIGAGFTMRHVRFGKTGVLVLLAVVSGFALYSFTSVANSLGAAGNIPISIAVWTPPVAAVLLTMGLLLHLEDG